MLETQDPTYSTLVREHHAAVYRTALRIVRQPADAEDVTQQVFLSLLRRRQQLQQARDPRDVLCWLAIRLALNHQRSARRRRAREEAFAMQAASDQQQPAARTGQEAEQRAALQHELDAMPDGLRLPLILRYQQGLTLAAAGTALGCSESSVHARVERALARLRANLQRLGFAAVLVRLDEQLAATPAEPVPPGLESKLLALMPVAATAGAAGSLTIAAGALALALGGASVWLLADRSAEATPSSGTVLTASHPPAEPAPAPPQDPVRPPPREPVAPAPTPPAAEPAQPVQRAVTGLVTDQEGRALAGAAIVATSVERQPGLKLSRFSVEARSDDAGRFALDVSVDGETQSYTFVVRRQDYVTWNSGQRRIAREGTIEPIHAKLARSPSTATTPYPCTVDVVDTHDNPVAGAYVKLYGPAARSGDPEHQSPEAAAVTGPNGSVRLTVSTLGPKLLRVDATRAGLLLHDQPLEFADRGPHQRRIVLAQGHSITGRIVGWTPATDRHFQLQAVRTEDGQGRQWAEFGQDGSFVLRGLSAGAWTLRGDSGLWSKFTLAGIAAGTSELVIELKHVQDPRPVGAHDAEIHGVLHDAVTGEDLLCGPFAVWLTRLPEGDAGIDFDQVAERALGFRGQLAAGADMPEPDRMFHVDGLEPGRYMLSAHKRGRAFAWTGPIVLGPREVRGDVRLELRAGGRIRGTVIDPAGRPLADAFVMLVGSGERGRAKVAEVDAELRASQGRQQIGYHHCTRTDAQGSFTLDNVPAGLELVPAVLHHAHLPHTGAVVVARDGESAAGVRLSAGHPR